MGDAVLRSGRHTLAQELYWLVLEFLAQSF